MFNGGDNEVVAIPQQRIVNTSFSEPSQRPIVNGWMIGQNVNLWEVSSSNFRLIKHIHHPTYKRSQIIFHSNIGALPLPHEFSLKNDK